MIFLDRPNLKRTSLIALASFFSLFLAASAAFGQSNDAKTRNNPYFPSPSSKGKQEPQPRVVDISANTQASIETIARQDDDIEIRPTPPQRTFKPTATTETRSSQPTEIYKIGGGDVIFVNLKNAANSSGYYTVQPNGAIDFPLAGENFVVTGKTADEVATMLATGITLYQDPQVEVKVREFSSHKINVTGMVERPGEKSIQREAMPLYVVCAEAGVDPKATKALIRRTDLANVETIDLKDANSDKILIYPGNSVEFTADGRGSTLTTSGFYYIAGDVISTGQKEFTAGMTLFQAILASGGAKGNPKKKAMIRRRSEKGTLNVAEYSLKSIKDGKTPDPVLSPGDMIEITN